MLQEIRCTATTWLSYHRRADGGREKWGQRGILRSYAVVLAVGEGMAKQQEGSRLPASVGQAAGFSCCSLACSWWSTCSVNWRFYVWEAR